MKQAIQIFDQNHRLTPMTFSWHILPKKKFEKWPLLDQNHGLTPLEKCPFF